MTDGFKSKQVGVVISNDVLLEQTEELKLGIKEIHKRLTTVCWWHEIDSVDIVQEDFSTWGNSDWVLIILNPAILISDNFLNELIAIANGGASCVLPADPRGYNSEVTLDYATRPGFDRFVSRLEQGVSFTNYDKREPWVYLVNQVALEQLKKDCDKLSLISIPSLLGTSTKISQYAFVHSYHDYHCHDRAEMLDMIPPEVNSLLDVGGGIGNFTRLFIAERGRRGVVLEINDQGASNAHKQGLDVLEGDFKAIQIVEKYDCISFLDVLEHMEDPWEILHKAHTVLSENGVLLLSIPNIGHWTVVWDLLEGHFEYQPVGILCNTHLRFFTRSSLESLLVETGFQIEVWNNSISAPPQEFMKISNELVKGGMKVNSESLSTDSFHVLARRI